MDIEPVPTRFDFERCARALYDEDVSANGVMAALDLLGWESGLAPKPLLCVHPSWFAYACRIAAELRDIVEPHATRMGGLYQYQDGKIDPDVWFIAWRGRRVGSMGA